MEESAGLCRQIEKTVFLLSRKERAAPWEPGKANIIMLLVLDRGKEKN